MIQHYFYLRPETISRLFKPWQVHLTEGKYFLVPYSIWNSRSLVGWSVRPSVCMYVSYVSMYTKCVLKWVLVRIAAFCCTSRPQIWIPEIEYYQYWVHAQIGPQGAEKQLSKVRVGGCWWWVYRVKTNTALALAVSCSLCQSLSIYNHKILTFFF